MRQNRTVTDHRAFATTLRSRVGTWAVCVGAVGLGGLLVSCSDDDGVSTDAATERTQLDGTATTTADALDMSAVQTFEGLTFEHVDGTVDYEQSPPVGGDHSGAWQNCGAYDEPVANENAVHSLEHGAVWLAHDPSLGEDDVDTVRSFARGQTHVLVSPYEGLDDGEAVVATGWGVQLRLDSVDDPRLAEFVATYQEGPQSREPGATCGGAIGEPIE